MPARMRPVLLDRAARAARPSLALVVLLALSVLGARSPIDVPVREAIQQEDPSRVDPPRLWSVVVDGWRIELDGVEVVRADAIPARRPDVASEWRHDGAGGLRLDKLALYADSIGRHAAEARIDWRLVAAVIAEESAFDASAMSPRGAFGLMQVKAEAARDVGVYPYGDPDSNILAGVRYLALMREQFPGATPVDHQAMMLAAYNMGPGHMRDARGVAERLGYPASSWHGGMALAVQMLERPAVHRNLTHGYAHGNQVIRYVDKVLRRYADYQRQFPSETFPSAVAIAAMAAQ